MGTAWRSTEVKYVYVGDQQIESCSRKQAYVVGLFELEVQ